MNNLEDFVGKLVEDKGFDEKDPEVIAQIKIDLLDRVEDRINALIISELKPEQLADFGKIMDSGSEEDIQKFIRDNIPDIDEKAASELLTFKNIYLG